MGISRLLSGDWLEYSGGSRGASSQIRFVKEGDSAVSIELRYSFDRETNETQHVVFRLTRAEFDRLIQDLFSHRYARIEKAGPNESLVFEWKADLHGIEFRLRGQTLSPFDGHIGVEIKTYRRIDCGSLSENLG